MGAAAAATASPALLRHCSADPAGSTPALQDLLPLPMHMAHAGSWHIHGKETASGKTWKKQSWTGKGGKEHFLLSLNISSYWHEITTEEHTPSPATYFHTSFTWRTGERKIASLLWSNHQLQFLSFRNTWVSTPKALQTTLQFVIQHVKTLFSPNSNSSSQKLWNTNSNSQNLGAERQSLNHPSKYCIPPRSGLTEICVF